MSTSDSQLPLQAQVGEKAVTVFALRVDGKKMTMQFFRQIPRAEWLDENLVPRKALEIWGRVHYRIPREGTEWLLVQDGGQLNRCCIDVPGDYSMVGYHQGCLGRAVDNLARHERQLLEEQDALEAAVLPEIKQIREGSLQRVRSYVEQSRADVAKEQTRLDEAIAMKERREMIATQIKDLSGIPQFYIG